MNILVKLDNYYNRSSTFTGKNNGLLTKILNYKFNKCLVCKNLNDSQYWRCMECALLNPKDQEKCSACFDNKKRNTQICGNCHNKSKEIHNYNSVSYYCDYCGERHEDIHRINLECNLCKKITKGRFVNIDEHKVCFHCLYDIDFMTDDSDDSYDSDDDSSLYSVSLNTSNNFEEISADLMTDDFNSELDVD